MHVLFQSVSGKGGNRSQDHRAPSSSAFHHTWCALLNNGIHIPEESQTQGNPKVSNLGRVTWPFLRERTVLSNS